MPSGSRLLVLAIALIPPLVPGCACLSGDIPLDEAAETLTQGDEIALRERMRPIRGTERVLLIAVDGVGHDALRLAIEDGRMPVLGRLLGPQVDGEEHLFAHAWAVPEVASILPSSTAPAWAAVFTGRPPAQNGVAGNEFFLREERRLIAPVPASVTAMDHVLETVNDDLVGSLLEVPTLFERAGVRTHVSMALVQRGADLFTIHSPTDLLQLMGILAHGMAGGFDFDAEAYASMDEESVDTIAEAVGHEGLPDLQVAYFPGADLVTHVAEDPLVDQQTYLAEVIDPAIAQLLELYREHDALERTWIVVVSDHGHTPVLDDDAHALATDLDTDPPAVAVRAGYRVRPFELETDDESFQVVFAYQGSMAYVYVVDRSTCPNDTDRCDWSRPPRYREDVLPLAQAFAAASRTGALVPQLRDTLDLVLTREPRPLDRPARPFRVLEGDRTVPVARWVAQHGRDDLWRLDERLEGLAVGPYGHRAGDILLIPRTGTERTIEGRYYFSRPYRSWHGAPHRLDSHVPLLVARTNREGAAIRRRLRPLVGAQPSQTVVTPIVLELLQR